jgi:hypothetical protein
MKQQLKNNHISFSTSKLPHVMTHGSNITESIGSGMASLNLQKLINGNKNYDGKQNTLLIQMSEIDANSSGTLERHH